MRSLSTFVFLAVLLSACSSTPKTSYYTLSAAPLPSAAATSSGTSVIVGPVSLPDSLDQPLLSEALAADCPVLHTDECGLPGADRYPVVRCQARRCGRT